MNLWKRSTTRSSLFLCIVNIGIISDTHSYLDERITHHLQDSDLIIHAGDVGDVSVLNQLEALAPTQGVYGNIDSTTIRVRLPEWELIDLDGVKILIIHIAGSIGRYNEKCRALIAEHAPSVLVCGHSHILKVSKDEKFNLLHINPGAAGKHGFHKVRTLLKVKAENGSLKDLQVIELGPRSAKSVH